MKTSLKEKLNDWLKSENGRTIYINELEQQVHSWGYKISNYERRLRPSESPNIERVMKTGAIIGYKYLGSWSAPVQNPALPNRCCVWGGSNGLHASDCLGKYDQTKVDMEAIKKQENYLF